MTYQTFAFVKEGTVGRMIFNRPEKRNCMPLPFFGECRQLFTEIDQDLDIHVVLIEAEGPHFSSGIDLAGFAGLGAGMGAKGCEGRKREVLYRSIRELQASFTAIDQCRVPVIAAVQGLCLGAGVDLITACDMRYASADAGFSVKEIDIGMTADLGTLQRLPKIIPEGIARELSYSGRQVGAEEALRIGLVNQVFADHADLRDGAMAIAKTIAAKSPLAITGIKHIMNHARDHSADDSMAYLAAWNAGMLVSEDLFEAMMANREKRPGQFKPLGKRMKF